MVGAVAAGAHGDLSFGLEFDDPAKFGFGKEGAVDGGLVGGLLEEVFARMAGEHGQVEVLLNEAFATIGRGAEVGGGDFPG